MKTDSEVDRYSPILQRMIELLGSDNKNKLTFALAMKQAERELKLEVPRHLEVPILVSAFKIMSAQKIPRLPEA